MEVEINRVLNLSDRELVQLSAHSLINIIHIIHSELLKLGRALSNEGHLSPSLQQLSDYESALKDNALASLPTSYPQDLEAFVLRNVDAAMQAHAAARNTPEVIEIRENLILLFSILKVRGEEAVIHQNKPLRWAFHDIALLKMNFFELFRAVEHNSQGRFSIVFNIAEQGSSDYLIHFDIRSVDGGVIFMPVALHDVMRDLIMNARKYTPPGGRVTAGLIDSGTSLCFVVEDNGIGIPEDEITRVFEFGYRASNVSPIVRQFGGGYGLTKAYMITRALGGRFWITSAPERGTRVRIEIPRGQLAPERFS